MPAVCRCADPCDASSQPCLNPSGSQQRCGKRRVRKSAPRQRAHSSHGVCAEGRRAGSGQRGSRAAHGDVVQRQPEQACRCRNPSHAFGVCCLAAWKKRHFGGFLRQGQWPKIPAGAGAGQSFQHHLDTISAGALLVHGKRPGQPQERRVFSSGPDFRRRTGTGAGVQTSRSSTCRRPAGACET